MCQLFFRQADHCHDGTAIEAVLHHGTRNFEFAFVSAFFNATLYTQLDTFLDALLLKLLYDGYECVSVLRRTLCQFA